MSLEVMIRLDSPEAKTLGFTSDKFRGYLFRVNDAIYISFIESVHKGQGNLSALFQAFEDRGFSIKVPNALPRMEVIVKKKGFVLMQEYSKEYEECVEVWVKKPQAKQEAAC